MHVEVSVALNFVISYLYNKLPRRRVDLLGLELEKGLKKKFEGHWYTDKPFKGSGFRCVRVNGEKMDHVIITAAANVGLSLEEITEYLPNELTLWIDPNEVSYRIGEKGQIKILYSDRNAEENNENEDREVQATNRGFNPEAQSFNPEPQNLNPDSNSFNTEAHSFNPEPQSFKPIDQLSASLGSLNLSPVHVGYSPSSPISSASWGGSQSTSPSIGAMFPPSAMVPQSMPAQTQFAQKTAGGGNNSLSSMFTTATFAATKFGSTKLKTNAKRPTRLSPTEFGNFLRHKAIPASPNCPDITNQTRSRSLSPRDPRVEFVIDQQHRMIQNQQQQQLQHQFHQQQLQLQHHQLNFQLQQQQQHQQQQQQFQQNHLSIPTDLHRMGGLSNNNQKAGSLHDLFSGPSPLQSPGQSPLSPGHQLLSNTFNNNNSQSQLFPNMSGQSPHSIGQSQTTSPMHSPMNNLQISPENQKALLDGIGINNVPYSNSGQYHHLLLAS